MSPDDHMTKAKRIASTRLLLADGATDGAGRYSGASGCKGS